MMTEIFNKNSAKQKRRCLLRNSPITESILWSRLRNNQLNGIKFKRQFSIGKFIVDFYSPKKRLAIEIDGDSHFTDDAVEYDQKREYYIKGLGISFLRFTNHEITENIQGVMIAICNSLEKLED